jgi:poly(3-hydroxybutyrate) depolymerase
MSTRSTTLKQSVVRLAAAAALTASVFAPAYGQSLANLKADPASITVSGISSGGYQAVQMHVAYSATFKGAAVFAGGPYYCAEGMMSNATGRCMKASTPIPVDKLVETTRQWAQKGAVDPVENLKKTQLYIFQGTKDTTVKPPVGNALNAYYAAFVDPANIVYDNQTPAEHAWITWKVGPKINNCATNARPFINNCGGDQERTFLEMFYGPLAQRAETASGKLLTFDQNEFFDNKSAYRNFMAEKGYVYLPKACEAADSNCRAHLALHGCKQNYQTVGDTFIQNAGLNEWADTNKLIVLYPQTRNTLDFTNPYGCWNWWGFGGVGNYAAKDGPQMKALKRMVDRATGQYGGVAYTAAAGGAGQGGLTPSQCVTDMNAGHLQENRAVADAKGYVFAKGSKNPMGKDDSTTPTTLKKTGPNTYVVGTCG